MMFFSIFTPFNHITIYHYSKTCHILLHNILQTYQISNRTLVLEMDLDSKSQRQFVLVQCQTIRIHRMEDRKGTDIS